MNSREEKAAIVAMLFVGVSYGVAGYTARELQEELGLWQQIALQNWGGLVISVLLHWIITGRVYPARINKRTSMELLGRAVFGRIGGSFFFIQACLLAPLGNVGWLSALPMSVMFAWVIYGERASRKELALLVLGLFGAGLIMSPSIGSSSKIGLGEFYAIVSCAASGLGAVLGKRAMKEVDPWSGVVWILLFTSLLSSILAFLLEGGMQLPSTAKLPVLGMVAVMVVIGSMGTLYGYAKLSASYATAILSLEAVWSIVFGLAIYGEYPSAIGIIGGSLIVWSAYAMQRKPKEKSREQSLTLSECEVTV